MNRVKRSTVDANFRQINPGLSEALGRATAQELQRK